MTTLFERLGGQSAVNRAVELFYRRVLADTRIKDYFINIDMDTQARKQQAFLTMAFGGPSEYSGQDMRAAHAHLSLSDADFDAVVENLAATLHDLGAAPADIAEVGQVAETVRDAVLNR